jgi:hypothetical protein
MYTILVGYKDVRIPSLAKVRRVPLIGSGPEWDQGSLSWTNKFAQDMFRYHAE